MKVPLQVPGQNILQLCSASLLVLLLASAMAQVRPDGTKAHGISVADMDRSVQPGDDFYHYANGEWIRRAMIPPDQAGISVFSQLDDLSKHRVVALVEDLVKSSPSNEGERKIVNLYRSYMDEAGIESKGLKPLDAEFAAINAIRDKHELARALGAQLRADVDPLNFTNYHTANFLGLWSAGGFEDPDHYMAYLLQGGIEMPDREYYLSDSQAMRSMRDKYRAHVIAMLKLAGLPDGEAKADRVIALEHAIAEKHWSLAEDQEVRKANNTWKTSDFAAKAPGLDWTEFFRSARLESTKVIMVWQASAITGEAALVGSTPLEAWKDWVTYHAIEDHADALPKAIADEHFNFFEKELTGVQQQSPRQHLAIEEVNGLLGDEVGRLYATRYFPPESKARVQAMVANIMAAFHKRIDAVPWMTAATKAQAHEKLRTLYVGIG